MYEEYWGLEGKMAFENKENYENFYSKKQMFLEYPADWIVRFWNIFLKNHIPIGRVLDYGCGSANNSKFFIEKGYEVYGIDVTEKTLPLIKANLREKYRPDRFHIISPDCSMLPFENNFFDFILSNQVLYYLKKKHIKDICKEFSRCLRSDGIVYFTVMGPKNYYITHKTKQIHNGNVYEVVIDGKEERLCGLHEFIYLIRDEDELKDLFSEFEPIDIGYFDQRMLDIKSNFHWIFVGKKRAQ